MPCEFNDASPKSYFTFKLEHYNKFNSISTIFTKNNNSVQTTVHRNYITNTCKIPNDSHHQVEHKVVGVMCLIKRMNNYCTHEDRKIKKNQSTQNTVHNNNSIIISNEIQRKILISNKNRTLNMEKE
jgi:hypothetical protein